MAVLEEIASNGVRTIIVETANRFARDLIVQETGWKRLHADGITLIAADSPDQFVDETPTAALRRLLDVIESCGAIGEPQEVFAIIEEDSRARMAVPVDSK